MAALVFSARRFPDVVAPHHRQQRHRRRPPQRQLHLAAPRASPSPSPSSPSFPPYEVVSKTPDYDLRIYAAHFAVECDYERRDEGYEKVGSYASGANADGARFVPSQPVVMHFPPGTAAASASPPPSSDPGYTRSEGEEGLGTGEPKVMSVHIGPRLQRGSASASAASAPPPLPTRDGVRLAARGGDVVAAARVRAQYATPEAALSAVAALRSALERDGLKVCERDRAGAFRLAQYGALFQLEERVNEVQLRVEL